MAETYKVLAQGHLTTTNDTDLYTVPSATETVISTIVVANVTSSSGTYNIAIRPDGDTLANSHYIAKGVTLGGNDSVSLTMGITLDAGDVITIATDTINTFSFNVFGTEIS